LVAGIADGPATIADYEIDVTGFARHSAARMINVLG